ncbi:MAG: NADase-type glycan-binding domain-containing protein [bacterium]
MDYSSHHGPCQNENGERIAFIASTRAYRKPTGLRRFPDGGIPRYLLEDVSLYLFTPETSELEKVTDFNDLLELVGSYRSSWKTRLVFVDGNLYFHVSPVTDWKWYKKQESENTKRTEKIKKLEQKYEKYRVYDLETKKFSTVSSEEFKEEYNRRRESCRVGLTELNQMLAEVPLSAWGLVASDIYSKPDAAYIEETIYARNPSSLTRRAVAEQIIAKLPPDKIRNLLAKMHSYKQRLEGHEKQEYETRVRDLRERLESILEVEENNTATGNLQQPEELVMIDTYQYTSVGHNPADNPDYPPAYLFDGDYSTCWVANASVKGENPRLLVRIPSETEAAVLNIYPGYGKSRRLYYQNARPRKLIISLFGGINPPGHVTEKATLYKAYRFARTQTVTLADTPGLQHISLNFSADELKDFEQQVRSNHTHPEPGTPGSYGLIMELEITEINEGTKYEDICISELFFNDRFVSGQPAEKTVYSEPFINESENALLARQNGDTVEIYSDPQSVLQLAEVSRDNNWLTLISMPANIEGRAETNYLLVDMRAGKVVNEVLAGATGDYRPGTPLYLEYDKNDHLQLNYVTAAGKNRNISLK